MKKVFYDFKKVEESVIKTYGFSEEVMIENAAMALEQAIRSAVTERGWERKCPRILILCGPGNNGADGYALARRLKDLYLIDFDPTQLKLYNPTVCCLEAPKSESCKQQHRLAVLSQVSIFAYNELPSFSSYDIIVDCIFGTGFHGTLPEDIAHCIAYYSYPDLLTDQYRIACDIPTGLTKDGTAASTDHGSPLIFKADTTVTMGARKTALYSDLAKDYCGSIVVGKICIPEYKFCNEIRDCDALLLEPYDLVLPTRETNNVHKGTFGHAAVIMGEKTGAAIIAGTAALNFGAGNVTLCDVIPKRIEYPVITPELIYQTYDGNTKNIFPDTTKAVVLGSGLGRDSAVLQYATEQVIAWLDKNPTGGLVLDADIFYWDGIGKLLEESATRWPNARIVLTPHPKECQELLKRCGACDLTVEQIVASKFTIVRQFTDKFPQCCLILKDANTLIAVQSAILISTEGRPCLAKAGSGDVLAGMLCALLAQGYSLDDTIKNAVLAHDMASQRFGSSYALTPFKLIEAVANLK